MKESPLHFELLGLVVDTICRESPCFRGLEAEAVHPQARRDSSPIALLGIGVSFLHVIPPAHAYPDDLARLVTERWGQAPGLPNPVVLERVLSVCFQASLLHDEGRPVTFRIALAEPEAFTAVGGPPAGLHRLVLSGHRPFDAHELRRLAHAAGFHRSLIGVCVSGQGELEVWGLIHSGQRWLQEVRGGRRIRQAIVATIRGARHGGTLIFLPHERASELCADSAILALKYRFREGEPRNRIFSLTVQIMNELARLHIRSSEEPGHRIGWAEYEASSDPRLAALDEALFEAAHLVAMLAGVDGAVIMTDRLEIIGFGAEISGALPEVECVDRSLDLEGIERVSERTDRVGTRHRSSYRLSRHVHDAFVIVVSQDGGVRFVRWQAGSVVYFDQVATGPWEV